MKTVHIFADGSCLGNPGPGGWGAILLQPDTGYRREISGGYRLTTNNRMEIYAVLQAVSALKMPCEVSIYTDSQYVCNAFEKKWIWNWQRRQWLKKNSEPVPNSDLWQALLKALIPHRTSFFWIRGHAGHPENERCDVLAKEAAAGSSLDPDVVYEALASQSRERS